MPEDQQLLLEDIRVTPNRWGRSFGWLTLTDQEVRLKWFFGQPVETTAIHEIRKVEYFEEKIGPWIFRKGFLIGLAAGEERRYFVLEPVKLAKAVASKIAGLIRAREGTSAS